MVNENDLMTIEESVSKVRDYLANASDGVQTQAVQTIRKLRNDGRSPLWIYYALTNNTVKDIERYGFSSVFSDKVTPRIDAKVEACVMEHYGSSPWGYLEQLLSEGRL